MFPNKVSAFSCCIFYSPLLLNVRGKGMAIVGLSFRDVVGVGLAVTEMEWLWKFIFKAPKRCYGSL